MNLDVLMPSMTPVKDFITERTLEHSLVVVDMNRLDMLGQDLGMRKLSPETRFEMTMIMK